MNLDILLTLISYIILFVYIFNLNRKYEDLENLLNGLTIVNDRLAQELEKEEILNENLEESLSKYVANELKLNEKLNNIQKEIVLLKSHHKNELKEAAQNARKDALKRSRAVIRGQASEHLAPFVIEGTNPKDYRFMGNPVDYICFEGLSDLLDGETDEIKAIHFIDIKTGKSSLNKSQRRIRNAINSDEKNINFKIINLDEELNKKGD